MFNKMESYLMQLFMKILFMEITDMIKAWKESFWPLKWPELTNL